MNILIPGRGFFAGSVDGGCKPSNLFRRRLLAHRATPQTCTSCGCVGGGCKPSNLFRHRLPAHRATPQTCASCGCVGGGNKPSNLFRHRLLAQGNASNLRQLWVVNRFKAWATCTKKSPTGFLWGMFKSYGCFYFFL